VREDRNQIHEIERRICERKRVLRSLHLAVRVVILVKDVGLMEPEFWESLPNLSRQNSSL
jgi:hypothetical protein